MSSRTLEKWSIDQQRAILSRGHNVLVSAGAGSGKTSVLVERVISLILDEPKIDVDELLIVTFTEAAASEMKERIRVRLEQLLKEAEDSEENQIIRRLITQISLIDQAQISTLHSFCLDIVRRNFLSLQLDQNFGLFDEQEAQELREEVALQMIEERLSDKDIASKERFQKMLVTFDATDPLKLLPIVLRIDTFSESQPDPITWLKEVAGAFPCDNKVHLQSSIFASAFYGWVLRLLDDARYGLAHATDLAKGVEGMESYLENTETMLALLHEAKAALETSQDLITAENQIRACLSLKSPRAKAGTVGKDEIVDIRKRSVETIKLLNEILSRGETALVTDLVMQSESVHELCKFVEEYKGRLINAKRLVNKLQFSDLEHFAKQALMDERTGERDRLRERFEALLVDEYQDTSPIQDAMIRLVVRDEGNLFTVGDVKQSIYRFRMAEPKLFISQYESLGTTAPGEVIDLSLNYRSRKEIVECVNFIFAQLFSEAATGFPYDERAKMRSGASYPDYPEMDEPTNRIEFHLIERMDNDAEEDSTFQVEEFAETDDDDGNAVDLSATQKEALVVGQRILELTGKVDGVNPELVLDKTIGEYRKASYQDIVILLRSTKGRVPVFLTVLRAMGIPTSGNADSGYYGSLEIQWLIALLTTIDNPRHELPLVTLLRSPFIGLTNEQLAKIRTAGKGNIYDALMRVVHAKPEAECEKEENKGTEKWWQEEELIETVRAFSRMFSGWRRLARRAPVSAVLNRVLADTGFVHYVSGMQGGQVRKRNVSYFLDEARAYDESSSDGVFGFVSHLVKVQKVSAGARLSKGSDQVDDSVRIMTIHGSKGLEFPIVFLTDLGKQFRTDKGEMRFGLHRDLGFGPIFNDQKSNQKWKTAVSIAIAELEKCESAAEEARILYVAMTRARERLIFVGSARNVNKIVDNAALISRHDELRLSKSSFLSAKTFLDWLIPLFIRHPECRIVLSSLQGDSSVGHFVLQSGIDANFHVQMTLWNHPHGREMPVEKLTEESAVKTGADYVQNERELVASMQELCKNQEASMEVKIVDKSFDSSPIPSKVSATELRRLWVANQSHNSKTQMVQQASAAKLLSEPQFAEEAQASPMLAGTAFHRLMQYLDFSTEPSVQEISKAIEALCINGKLTEDEAKQVNVEDVAGWLQSPISERVRKASVVYREQPFFHRIELQNSRYVIAQGVIDCLACDENGWLIVDYKTDQISEALAGEKAKEYEAQVGAYIAAVRSTLRTERLDAYLYFVKPRVSIRIKPMDIRKVFYNVQK